MTGRDRAPRRLEAGLQALGVALDAATRTRLLDYLDLLERWNRTFNLTAVRGRDAMIVRHLLDSLAIVPWVRGARALDVGSGAGVPGMVLAIAMPALEMTLLDASLKRTRFLAHAAHALGVDNVRVVRARLEAHRAATPYDVVVSRAALAPVELARHASRLLAPAGAVLAMLGRRQPQLDASLAGTWAVEQLALRVPGLAAERHLARLTRVA